MRKPSTPRETHGQVLGSVRPQPCVPGGTLVMRMALVAALWVPAGAARALPAAAAPPLPMQLPTGGQVVAGSASIAQSHTPVAAAMVIEQASQQAIINWQTFNLGAQAQLTIRQPGATSVLLNRVQSADPSQIFGQISANGHVFLSNPRGVYFAPGSRVDVGSFTATTHSIADTDFLRGDYQFSRNGSTGTILNQGTLHAGAGGSVALLAPEVVNQGLVVAQMGGVVALAAGERYELQFNDKHQLTRVLVSPASIQTLVDNGQAVQAPGGLIVLSAQAATGVLGGVVNNSGTLAATGLVNDGGVVRLSASHHISNTGSILADAAPGSAGNGGRIEVVSDTANPAGTARIEGVLRAQGGASGGHGGFIETSAATLTITDAAQISTLAPRGTDGTWLLDPKDFLIAASGGDLSTASLAAALNRNNVSIVTSGDAVACTSASAVGCGLGTSGKGDITLGSNLSGWNANTLSLSAYGNVNILANIQGTGSSALEVTPATGGSGVVRLKGSVTTGGGQSYHGNLVLDNASVSLSTHDAPVGVSGSVSPADKSTTELTVGALRRSTWTTTQNGSNPYIFDASGLGQNWTFQADYKVNSFQPGAVNTLFSYGNANDGVVIRAGNGAGSITIKGQTWANLDLFRNGYQGTGGAFVPVKISYTTQANNTATLDIFVNNVLVSQTVAPHVGALAPMNPMGAIGGSADNLAQGLDATVRNVSITTAFTNEKPNLTLSTGSGAIRIGAGVSNLGTLSFNSTSDANTVAGIVSGTSAVAMNTDTAYAHLGAGAGALTLAGANSYSGGTTVSAGTLIAGGGSNAALDRGPFGTAAVQVHGGSVDLNGHWVFNPMTLAGPAALVNSSLNLGSAAGAITLAGDTSVGGDGPLALTGVVSANGNGLALVGAGAKQLSNPGNTLATLASANPVGAIDVVNSAELVVGEVSVEGRNFTGLSSTGTVAVSTQTGNLVLEKTLVTASRSADPAAPALKLSAANTSAAGEGAQGNVLLRAGADLLVGAGGIAVVYTGNPTDSNAVASALALKTAHASLYGKSSQNAPPSRAGYYLLYRESRLADAQAVVPVFPAPGAASTLAQASSASTPAANPTSPVAAPEAASGTASTAESNAVGAAQAGVSSTVAASAAATNAATAASSSPGESAGPAVAGESASPVATQTAQANADGQAAAPSTAQSTNAPANPRSLAVDPKASASRAAIANRRASQGRADGSTAASALAKGAAQASQSLASKAAPVSMGSAKTVQVAGKYAGRPAPALVPLSRQATHMPADDIAAQFLAAAGIAQVDPSAQASAPGLDTNTAPRLANPTRSTASNNFYQSLEAVNLMSTMTLFVLH